LNNFIFHVNNKVQYLKKLSEINMDELFDFNEKKLKRSLRRHHAKRIKKKRTYLLKRWYSDMYDNLRERKQGMLTHTGTPCSCWACGNPRKFFGEKTLSEHRAILNEKDALIDLDDGLTNYKQ